AGVLQGAARHDDVALGGERDEAKGRGATGKEEVAAAAAHVALDHDGGRAAATAGRHEGPARLCEVTDDGHFTLQREVAAAHVQPADVNDCTGIDIDGTAVHVQAAIEVDFRSVIGVDSAPVQDDPHGLDQSAGLLLDRTGRLVEDARL